MQHKADGIFYPISTVFVNRYQSSYWRVSVAQELKGYLTLLLLLCRRGSLCYLPFKPQNPSLHSKRVVKIIATIKQTNKQTENPKQTKKPTKTKPQKKWYHLEVLVMITCALVSHKNNATKYQNKYRLVSGNANILTPCKIKA